MDSDRGEIRRWKSLFLPNKLTRGLFAFLIEHTEGHIPLPNEFPNSSINKLDHVVINTNDPDGFIEVYQDIYGIRLALDQTVEKWGGRMLFFRLNKTTIEVIAKKDENKITNFDPKVFAENSSRNLFLEGHFESEKYFFDYRYEISKEFSFKNMNLFKKSPFYEKLNNSNSISICLRQNRFNEGFNQNNDINFLKSKQYSKEQIDYINASIIFIKKRIDNPIFFLWSNDFTSIEDSFFSESIVKVLHDKEFYEGINRNALDLYLITQAKHHIVIPSTFNWWGAWLCSNKEKIKDWSDDRFWENLYKTLPSDIKNNLQTGPSIEKSIAQLRSYVIEPMNYKNIFLAGDAAHIVPPTGAKGLNLALSDVNYLSSACKSYFYKKSEEKLKNYSKKCLSRVWKTQNFSSWFTNTLHNFPDEDNFTKEMKKNMLLVLINSNTQKLHLANKYLGKY